MLRVTVENHVIMEKKDESSVALDCPTRQKNRTLAVPVVLGSIEGNQEPKIIRKKNKEKTEEQMLDQIIVLLHLVESSG
jgi:hypothetical protein